ncbi:hypothetical protein TWF718_008151 [Orbilia javanica]|uniref:F-box domain-containing protein n=1 Tax=Orbilia javanica TaxID=47235 RepID=A0AAN8RCW3_9PEZI
MRSRQNQEREPERSGPSPLLSLPEELIEQICQQLSSHRDSKSLAILCRTSKDLNRIATPSLYSGLSANRYMRRLVLFLRTLYERPDLCTYVRWLSLFASAAWFHLDQEHIEFISKTAERLGLDVLSPPKSNGPVSSYEEDEDEGNRDNGSENQAQDVSDEGEEQSTGNINVEGGVGEGDGEGGEEAEEEEEEEEEAYDLSQLGQYQFETVAQLIIALTPNLQDLQVEATQVMCDTGEGAFTMLEELAKRSPPAASLLHLHRFSFGHDDCREVSFKYFQGVIDLAPNIRVIRADPCFDQPEYALNDPINIRNVTDLGFTSGHISAKGLRDITSSCERLEVFSYCYSTMYAGLDPDCATPREIVDILSKYKNTLRHLDIDLGSREEHQGGLYFGFCIEGQEILSLKMFSCLETFKVDGSSILFPEVGTERYHTNILTEMLPQSIRTLHLRDTQKEAAANLITLTESLESFPHLSEIYLSGNGISGPLGQFNVIVEDSEIQILRERLAARGIRFLKRGDLRYTFAYERDEETREYW